MTIVERFRTSPAFRDLRAETLEALAALAREVRFRPDERIEPLINPPRRLVLIVSGVAKLAGATIDGQERIVYVFRRGDLIGSRILLEESIEAAYEVVAMTPVDGLAIEMTSFQALGRDHPDLVMAVTRALTRRLDKLTRRLMAAMSEDVTARLCRLLLDFVDEDQQHADEFVHLSHPLTHETMAHIVGASRPHTSSVLADLERQGVVERRRRDLLVRPAGLSEIVHVEGEIRGNESGPGRLGQRAS